MWVYRQSTGELFHNGEMVEKGYSGRMTNKNNPSRQQVKGLGPLPQGRYSIDGSSTSRGPLTIILNQVSGESYGRNEFRIHGEKIHGAPGWASAGCIIMSRPTRRRVLRSGDTILEVIP